MKMISDTVPDRSMYFLRLRKEQGRWLFDLPGHRLLGSSLGDGADLLVDRLLERHAPGTASPLFLVSCDGITGATLLDWQRTEIRGNHPRDLYNCRTTGVDAWFGPWLRIFFAGPPEYLHVRLAGWPNVPGASGRIPRASSH